MKTKLKKIKIELELDPGIATIISATLHQASGSPTTAHTMFNKESLKEMKDIAVEIRNQIIDKTDISPLKDRIDNVLRFWPNFPHDINNTN